LTIFREEVTSALAWFSCGSCILVELEFGDVGFCGEKKTGEPGDKPSEQGENKQQTRPAYGTGPEWNPGHIGGTVGSALTFEPSMFPIMRKHFFVQ